MKKTIIFGDIHGCHKEWLELLDKIGPSKEDQLVSVGDIVCKGPSTKKSLDLAMSLKNLKCILGNHEVHLLYHWKKKTLDKLYKDYQKEAVEELGNKINRYMKYINSWPYYLNLKDCIIIHGGLTPNTPLKKQDPKKLVSLRTIEPDHKPWYDYYKDDKLIVYGHWARKGLNIRKNTIGLDSGCVYGKELSALILPERKIVQVKAKKAYCPIT